MASLLPTSRLSLMKWFAKFLVGILTLFSNQLTLVSFIIVKL